MKKNSLTARFVANVTKPGRYGDAFGLMLLVRPTGGKFWIQRITIRGKRRDLGFGSTLLVSLTEARERAFEYWKVAKRGGDPTGHSDKVPLFEDAAEIVIEIQTLGTAPGNAHQWRASLSKFAYPKIGRKRIDEITSADCLEILTPIWATKATTARRVRARMSTIFKWAVAKEYRADDPAGEAITATLPKNNGGVKKHHDALHHSMITEAVEAIQQTRGNPLPRLCLEWIILTVARCSEATGARWSEIDEHARTWTVPGDRMKSKRDHVVPLSDRTMEILEEARELSDGSGLVFPSAAGTPMQPARLRPVLEGAGLNTTTHGFRSCFRDWCRETGVSREVAEACLAHVVPGVEGAYARSPLIKQRVPLMASWARYVGNTMDNVRHIA